MHPLSESPNMNYTVLDWAFWARDQGEPGAEDVITYLQKPWPAIRANAYKNTPGDKERGVEKEALEQGLATPVAGGPGARMMEAWGWAEGKGLGPTGDGVTEPLQPDRTHERREGLGFKA